MGQDPPAAAKAKPENHSASRRRKGKRVRRRRETELGTGLGVCKAVRQLHLSSQRKHKQLLGQGALPGAGAAGKWMQEEVQHVAPYELRLSNAVKCVKNGRKNQQTTITDSSNRWRGRRRRRVGEGRKNSTQERRAERALMRSPKCQAQKGSDGNIKRGTLQASCGGYLA